MKLNKKRDPQIFQPFSIEVKNWEELWALESIMERVKGEEKWSIDGIDKIDYYAELNSILNRSQR